MSSTDSNPYDFSRSNTVLRIGGQILFLFLLLVVVLTGTPPTMTPKNSVNSAIRNMLGASGNANRRN
jgi:hypothetical protein